MTTHSNKPPVHIAVYVAIVVALGALGLAAFILFTRDAGQTQDALETSEKDKQVIEGKADSSADKILALCSQDDRVSKALRSAGLCTDSVAIKETVAGPVGPQGIPGPTGPQGPPGIDGKNGKNGKNGTNGLDGQPGTDGQPGIDGTDGQDGTNGTNGANGVDGAKGDPGPVGPQGPAGKSCPEGWHFEEEMINGEPAMICRQDSSEPMGAK